MYGVFLHMLLFNGAGALIIMMMMMTMGMMTMGMMRRWKTKGGEWLM